MIIITDAAKEYIGNILEKNPGITLILGYDNSGCCGHKYTFSLSTSIEIPDNAQQISDRIVVAPGSIAGLDGATLDLRVEKLDQYLIWNNPAIVNSCGCGDSFQLAGEE